MNNKHFYHAARDSHAPFIDLTSHVFFVSSIRILFCTQVKFPLNVRTLKIIWNAEIVNRKKEE